MASFYSVTPNAFIVYVRMDCLPYSNTCAFSILTSTVYVFTAVSCGFPQYISHGYRGTPTSATYGGTVTYSCDTGYQLSGSATVTCQASGSWSTRPSCTGILHCSFYDQIKWPVLHMSLCSNVTAVSCGYPPSISNGFRGTPTHTTYGGTVTYSCDTGYQMSGSATVTCQASGSWSTRPSCTGTLHCSFG